MSVAGVLASDPVHQTEDTRSPIEAVQPTSCTPVSTNRARDVLSPSNDSEAGMSFSPRSPRSRSSTPREGKPRWVRCRLDQQNRKSEIAKAMGKKLSTRTHGSKDKKKNHCSYEDMFDQLLEWSSVHIDELMSKYGPDEQSSGHGSSCGQGSDATTTPKSRGGSPCSDALKWRDGKPGYPDNGPMFERLTVRNQMAMWDTKARSDVVFIEPVKLLQILGMFEQTCPQHGKDVEETIKKIYYPCHICKLQFESNDPVVVLVDGRYDSSRDAQHCTVKAMDLKSGMIVGTETMLRGNESSWKLETQCVGKLLHRLKDEKNLIIAKVVHDDCGAVDVILRRMNIDSQKCMWHKAKTLVKRLREAVRGTKTVKPVVVGACEHVREVKCFTKKELELLLETKCVHVPGVSTKKKDELVEIVWGVLFPNEAGKALPDDVVEIDALQTLHCNAAEEAKEWLYGACRVRERAKDDDGDVLATHVQHLANHWVGDHSRCDKELSNLCKAAGGPDREPLYEAGARVHLAIVLCLEQFASNTKMAYYTRVRMTFNNECFHSVINNPRVGDWARNMLQQSDVDDPVIEHYDEEADYGLPDAVESAVEGVVAEGGNVFVEAGSESASDDEKSSSDSDNDGAAHRLDFDGAVLSQEVSVAQE
ncbi:hypothetical protein CBR_g38340 [Chara braunii]|uniref:Uncharacterized protein n=1 Tax=Chara braunii TaxID=69332 RepID=A0A388LPV9_CHABU|nr:hypothetical protein CBR_g38340 [Chara braunii]|eukprot:GBG84368.1 hypothetical protein CBR_g38340 [Chara braunii]